MIATTIKIIAFLYPFLKELLLGKHSNSKNYVRMKMAVIVLVIVSVILNLYLVMASLKLSKDKIDHTKKITTLETKVTELTTKPTFKPAEEPICRPDPEGKPFHNDGNQHKKLPPIVRKEDLEFEAKLYRKLKRLDKAED